MAHVLELSHTYPQTPAQVFTAWTDAGVLRRWCCPDESMVVSTCDVDARVGGGYDVVFGPAPGGDEYAEKATYVELEPGRRLVMELALTGGGMDEHSVATLTFTAVDGGTRLELRNEGLSSAEVAAMHRDGWAHSLAQVGRVVGTG